MRVEAQLGIAGIRWLGWLALAAAFLGPFLFDPFSTGSAGHDWTYFVQHAVTTHASIATHGELPQWNPWYCGGVPALGNGQSGALSPMVLLLLAFGPIVGLKLALWLYLAIAMEGAYHYARHVGAAPVAAALAGIAFGTCGRFVNVLADGQLPFMGFALFPWLLLCYERGFDAWRQVLVGGLLMAWVFAEGGVVTTPLIGVCLAVHGLVATLLRAASGTRSRWWAPARCLLVMGVVAAGVSAIRLLPFVQTLVEAPRIWTGQESYGFQQIGAMFFATPAGASYAGPGTAYLGPAVGALAAFALVRLDPGSWRLLPVALLLLDLSAGYEPLGLGTYELLERVPVLGNLRNPFRYTFLLALYVAVVAARGVTVMQADQRRLVGRLVPPEHRLLVAAVSFVPLAIAAVASLQAFSVNAERVRSIDRMPTPLTATGPFRQSLGNRWRAHVWPLANLGTLGCFEEQPFFTSSALRGDLAQEEYLADARSGRVTRVGWSPHRIVLEADLRAPGLVVVNQNRHRGWQVDPPAELAPHRGLLAAAVPAGRHQVVFRFSDPLVRTGAWISALSLLCVAGLSAASSRLLVPLARA